MRPVSLLFLLQVLLPWLLPVMLLLWRKRVLLLLLMVAIGGPCKAVPLAFITIQASGSQRAAEAQYIE